MQTETTSTCRPVPRRRRTSRSSAVKRDILRRSSVGVIAHGRRWRRAGPASNRPTAWTALRVLQQPDDQHVLGEDADRGPRRATTRAIARSSITPATATASNSNGWWSATTSIPKSGSCAATTCGKQLRAVPLQPASGVDARRSASSRGIGHGRPTSRTAPGGSRRATSTASSRSSSRTAIGSASASPTTTSCCSRRSASRPACGSRSAATTSRRARRLQLRPAAAVLGQRGGRARELLRRPPDDASASAGAAST